MKHVRVFWLVCFLVIGESCFQLAIAALPASSSSAQATTDHDAFLVWNYVPTLTALIVAVVAIIGQVVAWRLGTSGIKAQERTTKQQIQATVVSANRQAWINDLRDDLADLIAMRKHAAIDIRAPVVDAEGLTSPQKDLLAKIEVVRERIRLRLNPTESEHETLIKLVDEFVTTEEVRDIVEIGTKISVQAQKILKAEWVRVKGGDKNVIDFN